MATLQERAANKEQRDLANRRTLEAIKAKKQETDIQVMDLAVRIGRSVEESKKIRIWIDSARNEAKLLYREVPGITGSSLFKLQHRILETNIRAILWLLEMAFDAINIVEDRLRKMEKIITIMK